MKDKKWQEESKWDMKFYLENSLREKKFTRSSPDQIFHYLQILGYWRPSLNISKEIPIFNNEKYISLKIIDNMKQTYPNRRITENRREPISTI